VSRDWQPKGQARRTVRSFWGKVWRTPGRRSGRASRHVSRIRNASQYGLNSVVYLITRRRRVRAARAATVRSSFCVEAISNYGPTAPRPGRSAGVLPRRARHLSTTSPECEFYLAGGRLVSPERFIRRDGHFRANDDSSSQLPRCILRRAHLRATVAHIRSSGIGAFGTQASYVARIAGKPRYYRWLSKRTFKTQLAHRFRLPLSTKRPNAARLRGPGRNCS